MKLNNFNSALTHLFGAEDCMEKQFLLSAIQEDINLHQGNTTSFIDDAGAILAMFNEVFNKRSRVITKRTYSKYKEVLKLFTMHEIRTAMECAKADEFHIETNFKYCTVEYFSRVEQVDKWFNAVKDKVGFVLPKMNL